MWQLSGAYSREPHLIRALAACSLGSPHSGSYVLECFSEPEEGRLVIFSVDFAFDQGPIRDVFDGPA